MRTTAAPRLELVTMNGRRPTPAVPAQPQGFRVLYRPGEPNRCPSCGLRNWYVGRTTAECGSCDAVLPIARDGRDQ